VKVLGIETSCDETAAAVVQDGQVLSSVVHSQVELHAPYGGVVPELASRNHSMWIHPVITQALAQAGLTVKDIDGIAVTEGPGLIGSLIVGVQTAKGMARAAGLPVVGVNHVRAHLIAAFLGPEPPEFPYIGLAVSGGHTSLYQVKAPDDFVILGRTLDDAAGGALDKAGIMLGLPYPGGVHIDRIAKHGNPAFHRFPRAFLDKRPLDFSFSGMKTALKQFLQGLNRPLDDALRADVAASFLQAVVDVLVHKVVQAARQTGIRRVVVAGGVAANSVLRRDLAAKCAQEGISLHLTPMKFCTDNAAMIAALGYHYLTGQADPMTAHFDLDVDPFPRQWTV
jgi:N6-L-threonylcarbamoyladenine synthase